MPDKKAIFEFREVTAFKLVHINVRRELHGDQKVNAMDLRLRKEGGNELLDKLDLMLRQALYYNAAATEGQEALPEVLQILPNLRVPKLNGQKYGWAKGERHKGYRFVLDYGLGPGESNVELDSCTVTAWAFEAKEGGTVVLEYTVQYAGDKLTDEVRGKLTGLTDETIHVQLFAPETAQIVKGKDKPAGGADPDGDEGGGNLLNGQGGDQQQDGSNPSTPLDALKKAHGVTADAD